MGSASRPPGAGGFAREGTLDFAHRAPGWPAVAAGTRRGRASPVRTFPWPPRRSATARSGGGLIGESWAEFAPPDPCFRHRTECADFRPSDD